MDWQAITTLICIAAAILIVARRVWLFFCSAALGASSSDCSGCGEGGCGPDVVSLSTTLDEPSPHDSLKDRSSQAATGRTR